MKTAVSSYSFSRLLQAGAMTQLDCVQKAAEMGFDAIEFVDILPHDGSAPEEYAGRLGEACKRAGRAVSNYTVGADFLTGSAGDLQAEVKRVCGQVDLAACLGAASMRHDATGGYPPAGRSWRGFDQALPRLAEGCRAVAAYGEKLGIRTMVENHGYFCQESRRVEKLVNMVAHENFGLLNDMGNFLCVDENPAEAVGRVAPYAFYVHAKDFILKSGMEPDPGEGFFRTRGGNRLRGTIIGHGCVPVRQCLSILKQNGYDGYVSIEFEGMEDPLQALPIGLANLRRYLEEA